MSGTGPPDNKTYFWPVEVAAHELADKEFLGTAPGYEWWNYLFGTHPREVFFKGAVWKE